MKKFFGFAFVLFIVATFRNVNYEVKKIFFLCVFIVAIFRDVNSEV